MADRWAVASGNWSNPATWNGGTLPGAGDDVYADGLTVTVDISPTFATVRTQQRSGGTEGGGFTLTDGVVLPGDAIAGTTPCLTFSGTASATLAGSATGGSGVDDYGAYNVSIGTLTIGLNATGGSGSSCHGAFNNSTGTITIGGEAATGGNDSRGAFNNSTGTITIGLNAISTTSGIGAYNNSSGTLTIGLSATGGLGASA